MVSFKDLISKSQVHVAPKASRCEKVLASMQAAKHDGPRGNLPSGLASSINGKLSFISVSSLFGGIGRAACLPFLRRAHPESLLGQDVEVTSGKAAGREGVVWKIRRPPASAPVGSAPTAVVRWTDQTPGPLFGTLPITSVQVTDKWSDSLSAAHFFFQTIFRPTCLPRRTINVSAAPSEQPAVMLCDASSSADGSDEIGVVFFDPAIPDHPGFYTFLTLPAWLSDFIRPQQESSAICPAELIAFIIGLLTFADKCHDRRVLAWSDNMAAFSCMVHGFSSSKAMSDASNIFHLTRAALQTDMWTEWVASDANISDIPSRNQGRGHKDEEAFRQLGLTFVPAQCPSFDEWQDPVALFDKLRARFAT